MNPNYKRSALAVVAGALAAVLVPPTPMAPSAWAREHLVLPDGPHAGELWDPSLTPYIIEPLDQAGPDSPVNEQAVMKSAQTGFTTLMLAAIGHSIDRDPCRMMVVQPTDAALGEFNKEKLGPTLERTKPLSRKVRSQTTRSALGSTTYTKKFPQGSLTLAIATSSSDLSSKTVKKVFNDEIDRYPDDVDNQGDPLKLIEGRYTAFRRTGDWKRIDVSTPTLKGYSSIEKRYNGGDKRRWHVSCPGCSTAFVFAFDRAFFRFNDSFPHEAFYAAPCCGRVIEAHERDGLVRAGRWIATDPRPGAYPSYHFDTLSSPFVPWDDVAAAYIGSRGHPTEEKAFTNLWLGLPYEEQTTEVSPAAIVSYTEDYPRGIVPPRVGLTTLAVDFNGDFAEWALWGFGPSVAGLGVDQWLIETNKIDGSPDDPALWDELAELVEKPWPYAGGQRFRADLVGLDTGFGTHEVYKFVRGRHRLRALDGRPTRPGDPMKGMPLGTPKRVPVKDRYGRTLFKVWLYPVGSHELKRWLTHALENFATGKAGSNAIHLPREIVDEPYADQLTSEALVPTKKRNGGTELRWKKRRGVRNEALDLATYARAVAFGARSSTKTSSLGLGVEQITPQRWVTLLEERHGGAGAAPDLFSDPAPATAARAEAEPQAAPAPAPKPKRSAAAALARMNRQEG